MKQVLIILGLILVGGTIYAQGIKFENSASWDEFIEKAKKEQKYIFVDCYATWCGPCKQMEEEVFNNSEVGDFFSEHFISVRIQFDSTKNDTKSIVEQFAFARHLENKYKVKAFPTYLFFDKEGKLVSKEMGAILPAKVFLEKSKQMLDPNWQYYTLKARFENGDRSTDLVKRLLPNAVKFGDGPIAYLLHDEFVDLLDPPYTKDEISAIYGSISSIESKGFKLLLQNPQKMDSILEDDGRVESVVKTHLVSAIHNKFIKDKQQIVWNEAFAFAKSIAPIFADKIILGMQVDNALYQQKFEKFGKLKMDYYDRYAAGFTHNEIFWMNNDIMRVFEKCFNKKTLKRAARWSKTTIYRDPEHESPAATDTFANLLYKSGQVKEAIKWQKRAIELVSDDAARTKRFQATLDKMCIGVPTWPSNINN